MNTVEEIQAIQKELREAMGAREAGAQAFIRGLTAEVATQQGAADQLPASQVRPSVSVGKGRGKGFATVVAHASPSVGSIHAMCPGGSPPHTL